MSDEQGPLSKRNLALLGVGGVALVGIFLAQQFLGRDHAPARPPAQTASSRQPAKQPARAGAAPGATVERGERPGETKVALEGRGYRAQISTRGATLRRFALTDPRFQRNGHPIDLVSTTQERYFPLRLRVSGDVELPFDQLVDFEVVDRSARHVRLRYRDESIEVVRRYDVGSGPYQLWVTSRVTNLRSAPAQVELALDTFSYGHRSDEGGGLFGGGSRAWHAESVCLAGDSLEREDRSKLEDAPLTFTGPVQLVSLGTAFFHSAVATSAPARTRGCVLRAEAKYAPGRGEPDGDLFHAQIRYRPERLQPGQSSVTRELGYFGPKDLGLLALAGHGLAETVNLGFFSFIARGLLLVLQFIHRFVGNWGIAIILLTLAVKLLLFPLTARSFKSMNRMKELKPELDKLNQLYKDDREKRGAATMELYRKAGVNPFGGCLPSLAQLPVWWALYTTLQISVELYRAPFLFWSDLSAPDPFYVMPIVLGGLMFLQQRLTPTTMDPTQAKIMMYAMPAMFTVFMLFLPVGLCLYMTVNSALSILQQQAIMRSANRPTPSPEQSAPTETVTDPPGAGGGAGARDHKPRRKSRGGR